VTHDVIIMIELGDLREGILPGTLVQFYRHVFRLPNIQVVGVGANLGCLAGAVPAIEQFMQLAMYRELLELKFKVKIPFVSAGSSAVLPLVLDGTLPRAINHFRIGEAIFLGTDLIHGGTLEGLRDDVFLLQAEVTELKEKSLVPLVETGDVPPFEDAEEEQHEPGQRGYRALVNLGQLDTDVGGLHPLNPAHHIAGASSDITVVNIGEEPRDLRVGGSIAFRPGYGALARLMESRYVEKVVRSPSAVQRPDIRETA
jgi:predicted amino acid racemase